jgi:hypothetical protein
VLFSQVSRRGRIRLAGLGAVSVMLWAAGILTEPFDGRYIDIIIGAAITATLSLIMACGWLTLRQAVDQAVAEAWVAMRDGNVDYLLDCLAKASQRAASSATGPLARVTEMRRRS